ncbi:OmpH family outer membrane protein [bacterium]|nr:OmpH family outer membrane protein [bacterium]
MKNCASLWLLFALSLTGCTGKVDDGKLRVGVLDTSRILSEMPKYKDLQSNLVREQREFQSKLPQPGADISQEDMKQLQKEADKKRLEFQKRVNTTVQTAIKDIRDLTTQVAEEKNLDIVVVSTPYTPSVHYHSGQDITIDVMLKMKRI